MPIRPGQLVRGDDTGDDHQRRQRGRFHRHGKALDDVGAMAAESDALGDRLDRTVVGAGVIFGDPDDQPGDAQPDEHAVEQLAGVEHRPGGVAHADRRFHVGEHRLRREPQRRDRQQRGSDEALVERAHDRAAAETDEIGADDRGQDADAAGEQRQRHQPGGIGGPDEQCHQHHRRAQGDDIGFEQVGRHAGAVADIITDVIGDDAGVAVVVLIEAEFVLADHVGPHVGGLGEDAAAQPREDRDQRGAEAQRHQRIDDRTRSGLHAARRQHVEIAGDGEQREPGDEHPRHRARTERHGQALLEPGTRRFGGADVGADRDVHADEAGRPRQHRAEYEADRGNQSQRDRDQCRDDHADDADRGILLGQIGPGTLLDRLGDFLHPGVAGRRAKDLHCGQHAIDDSGETAQDRDQNDIHGDEKPLTSGAALSIDRGVLVAANGKMTAVWQAKGVILPDCRSAGWFPSPPPRAGAPAARRHRAGSADQHRRVRHNRRARTPPP